jgi:hypothetical protein
MIQKLALGVRVLLGLSATAGWAADFNVSNSGFTAYVINGTNNATLQLLRGRTYTFALAAAGHPFWIKTNRVTGTGSAYTNGVTGNGLATGTLTFAVPTNAPNSLVYICQLHAGMVGTLLITNPPAPPKPAVLTNWLHLPNGDLQFTVAGTPGLPHRVQAVAEVTASNWVSLVTNTPANGNFTFTITNPTSSPRRFYRVLQ